MRSPVTHPPVQAPQPPHPALLDDEDGSLPPPRLSGEGDDPRSFVHRPTAGEAAPVIDWPAFPDDVPPLQERRRR